MKAEKLVCSVQNYDWGQIGNESIVALLKHSAQPDFIIDNKKPYAELWMGIHPNGPSKISSNGELLSKYIAENPTSLGTHEDGTIKFLFKVLSVNKALSIQSHPSKEQAVMLHSRDPSHYPDVNHKPEMAIALSDFELLCGFREAIQIYDNIKGTPELLSLIKNKDIIEQLKDEKLKHEALKQIFADIMRSSSNDINTSISLMIDRLKQKTNRTSDDELSIRLYNEFGGDVGIFAALLLNHYILKKGEAVYLRPNKPHAYLHGDCIECMACSDNTVRAGLTPKFKDVETLCSQLTFEMMPPPHFEPRQLSDSIIEYAPPVYEFSVHLIKSGADSLWNVYGSSILLVTNGSAKLNNSGELMQITRGDSIFIPASLGALSLSDTSADFIAYRAFTPVPK